MTVAIATTLFGVVDAPWQRRSSALLLAAQGDLRLEAPSIPSGQGVATAPDHHRHRTLRRRRLRMCCHAMHAPSNDRLHFFMHTRNLQLRPVRMSL